MATKVEQRIAEHGQKMIEVQLRFWTNDIAEKKGQIVPKHAWAAGVVKVESNKSHGIQPANPLPFHSLLDLGAVIEKALIQHGITLHSGRKMQKYFDPEQ
jgi:hypothetical protein